jgi:NAD(P)-dependent dehydrogenase (short-subunit alcohol dehydrogenase family)
VKRLEDHIAIITGGTSGIGRACAERFVEEGARVVVAGRRRAAGSALVASLGEHATFVAADVTREDDIRRLVEETLRRFGRIDCVISNAGATSATSAIADTDPGAFDHDLAVHVRAPFLAMKYASPAMVARRRGSFIRDTGGFHRSCFARLISVALTPSLDSRPRPRVVRERPPFCCELFDFK